MPSDMECVNWAFETCHYFTIFLFSVLLFLPKGNILYTQDTANVCGTTIIAGANEYNAEYE